DLRFGRQSDGAQAAVHDDAPRGRGDGVLGRVSGTHRAVRRGRGGHHDDEEAGRGTARRALRSGTGDRKRHLTITGRSAPYKTSLSAKRVSRSWYAASAKFARNCNRHGTCLI